jgi:phthiodiolone/phenolphthiodiolone dimycocerosates ketoreductase
MASGGKRTLALTGKYGDGWLPIGYTPELFEDHKKQIEVSMNENNRTQEEKDSFQMALDIDVYFSDDAEESWAKMKEAVKVSLKYLECMDLKKLKDLILGNTLRNILCLTKIGL